VQPLGGDCPALLNSRQRLQATGIDLRELADLVGKLLAIDPVRVCLAGKQPERVRVLGLTATVLGREPGIIQSAMLSRVPRPASS